MPEAVPIAPIVRRSSQCGDKEVRMTQGVAILAPARLQVNERRQVSRLG